MNEYYEKLYDTILKEHLWQFVRTGCCPECNSPAEYEVTLANDFETKKETRHIWTFGKRVLCFDEEDNVLYGYCGQCLNCKTSFLWLSYDSDDINCKLYKYSDFGSGRVFTEPSFPGSGCFRLDALSDIFYLIKWNKELSLYPTEYTDRLKMLMFKYCGNDYEYKKLERYHDEKLYDFLFGKDKDNHDPYEFHEVH